MPQQPFIEVQHVNKTFGKHVVLEDVNLQVPYGEIFGIIGQSGSGKSTLLNLLIGFMKPTQGQILFQSRDIFHDLKNVKQQFGFTAQEGSFYPQLTVKENLEYFGALYNVPPHELEVKIPSMLKYFSLEEAENILGSKLSIGMQKRLDIACGLIHEPKVLILDEPTENLDPALRKEILNLLKRINKQGVTIIMTSHLLDEVEAVCEFIAILHKKRIIKQGTVDDLKDRYSKNQEIHLETVSGNYAKIIKELKERKNVEKIISKGHKIIIYTAEAEAELRYILGLLTELKEKLMDVDVNKPSLSEVFESVTANENPATG